MTRLPSARVNKSQQRNISHNDDTTIHWSNKSQQQTISYNDETTIHWITKESSWGTNRLTGEVQIAQIKRPATCCYEKEVQQCCREINLGFSGEVSIYSY